MATLCNNCLSRWHVTIWSNISWQNATWPLCANLLSKCHLATLCNFCLATCHVTSWSNISWQGASRPLCAIFAGQDAIWTLCATSAWQDATWPLYVFDPCIIPLGHFLHYLSARCHLVKLFGSCLARYLVVALCIFFGEMPHGHFAQDFWVKFHMVTL